MAAPLKMKQSKEKKEDNKKKKFKRKRDVFGKSLSRIGIVVLIIAELVAFGVVKTVFTIKQNKEQKQINEEIAQLNKDLDERTAESKIKQEKIDNLGSLIATLPTTFDRDAVYVDLNRMITLSGLKIDDMVSRTCVDVDEKSLPFETKSTTLKAKLISFRVIGELYDVNAIIQFIDYLTQYKHENFYYISDLDYSESIIDSVSYCNFGIMTFYNEVTID